MVKPAPDKLIKKLQELDAQYQALDRELLLPEVQADHRRVREISVKRAAIEPLVHDFRAYRREVREVEDLQELLAQGADADLAELARQELPGRQARARQMLESIQRQFVTAADRAVGSIILELRAGVGGDEAGIWAGDLVEMYRRYAAGQGWEFTDLQLSPSEAGGFKSAIVRIAGPGVWSVLGYEGGTHQVKRVPATEAQGRVHTSTATVAVLPEPRDIEIDLDPRDVREVITHAQGPGGQNVNKVATAVHLIHEPSGIEVRMQESRSQMQNREKAWRLLRARLYEQQQARADAERAEARSAMIGGARRAEKIRTYRYKENIVVDHRLGRSFNLTEIMSGRLQPLLDALLEQDTAQRLSEM
jgi:peptide chain release factor 1